MMSEQIIEESHFLAYCFMSGVVITIIYDLFRILRRIIKHTNFFIAIEDLFFWIGAGIFLFFMLYKTNNGMIRWFSVSGAGLGMLVYKYTIGEHLVEIMSTILNRVLDMVFRAFSFVLRPVKALTKQMFGKVKRVCKKMKRQAKKKLTGNIKKIKITLCKRKKQTGKRGRYETKNSEKSRISR